MLKIRPATENDAHSIATINVLGWKTAYRGLVPDSILDAMEVSEKRIQRFSQNVKICEVFLVAENETGVIGFLSGGRPRSLNLPYSYELYTLYVHPDFQRIGVGTALFKAFKQEIKNLDFCVYMLDGHLPALKFYRKMGGIREPQFDCDKEINRFMTHDLLLVFKGNE